MASAVGQGEKLKEQRAHVVPPLPGVFGNLQDAPKFREDPESFKHADLFPVFAGLKPLILQPQGSASGQPAQRSPDSEPRALRVGVVIAGELTCLPSYPTNVIVGLHECLMALNPGSKLIGFLGGPEGLLQGRCKELTAKEIKASLNLGSWKLLSHGSCRDGSYEKERRKEEAIAAAKVCQEQRLDTLVMIAGPKDLSWAATLATCFVEEELCQTKIIGVPHSKHVNLYVPRYLAVTLGFDTARRLLSEVAGNIFVDSLSSNKYWHFIRCGEDALTLEVALQTRCTFSVLTSTAGMTDANENETTKDGLSQVVSEISEVIRRRRKAGRHSGVVLISRQFIETLPEMDELKSAISSIVGPEVGPNPAQFPRFEEVEQQLPPANIRPLFKRLPRVVQRSLIWRRDAAGKPLLPRDLEAERIIGRFVQQELRSQPGLRKGGVKVKASFAPRFHAMEITTSSPLPSAFDCAFGYMLGHTAAMLVREQRNFYVACCAGMHLPPRDWQPCAIPFTYLYPDVPLPKKASCPARQIPKMAKFVKPNLREVFRHFKEAWVESNVFKSPGPMQFDTSGDVGPLSDRPYTLLADYLSVDELKQIIQPVLQPAPLVMSTDPYVVRDARVKENLGALEQQRLRYKPAIPSYLRGPVTSQEDELAPHSCDSFEELVKSFPLTTAGTSAIRLVPPVSSEGDEMVSTFSERSPTSTMLQTGMTETSKALTVGIVFASSQVPGFHPALAGLFDYLSGLSPPAKLIGFFCGYEGLIKDFWAPMTQDMVDQFRNLGGQDLLCQFGDPSTLAFKDHLQGAIKTIMRHQLDGLVMVGNLANQVDTAFLAEACAAERLPTKVIGVPVSLDCNFPFVQQSVGFDTVTRTLSAFVGTIGNLVKASRNMWIFVRTMGDAWSHVAVQITLETHVHMVLMSGSQLLGQYLAKIVQCLCDLIVQRHEAGQDHGIIMLPVGFVNDILELRVLFSELMEVMSRNHYEQSWDSIPSIASKLKPSTAALFEVIPRDVQYEMCFGGRERYMNKVDFSTISTDRLLLRFVEIELHRRRQLGIIKEDFFNGTCYPMTYQARSAIPTNFDCDLAYTLGWSAGIMIQLEKPGLLVHATKLECDVNEWRVRGLPLTCLLRTEYDEESQENRILPAYVHLLKQRTVKRPFSDLPPPKDRIIQTLGPVQFSGVLASLSRTTWYMLNEPLQDPTDSLRETAYLCGELQSTMALAKAESTLYAVNSLLQNAVSVLEAFKQLHDSKKRGTQSLADVPVEHLAKVWTTQHHNRSSDSHSDDRTHHSTRHEAMTRSTDLVLA